MEFVEHFKEVFPRLIIYLAVPFYLGIQFSILAKEERRAHKDYKLGSYALDAVGLLFSVGVPALFLVSSLAIFKMDASRSELMAGVFRYGLMFFFLGAWWQFFGIMALKAYINKDRHVNRIRYLLFYLGGSVFISLNLFLGGEWFLKWMSLAIFAVAAPLVILPCSKMCKAYLIASVAAFILQTAGFIWFSSVA